MFVPRPLARCRHALAMERPRCDSEASIKLKASTKLELTNLNSGENFENKLLWSLCWVAHYGFTRGAETRAKADVHTMCLTSQY